MKQLDLRLTMLGRRYSDNQYMEYGFRTSDGKEYWCAKYQLSTIMGRVTRIRLWYFLKEWEKKQGKSESQLTNYEDFKKMLAAGNWPDGFDPGYVPYQ